MGEDMSASALNTATRPGSTPPAAVIANIAFASILEHNPLIQAGQPVCSCGVSVEAETLGELKSGHARHVAAVIGHRAGEMERRP